ncbi:hypothetical protein TruAng_004387 [Truncatella angustata]|nr:hypothetical protein TruAng_004387 [Truncatella angustata]
MSEWWYIRNYTGGLWHEAMQNVHQKYGPVVRIGPNELSFSTPSSYKTIYNHANKDRKPFLKSDFYDISPGRADIITVRDPADHALQRRCMAYAFSVKSLRQQEETVHLYLDEFIKQIGRLGSLDQGVDMTEAFNWLTFDIIGDLTFGKSFDAVKEAKTHFWISLILGSVYLSTLAGIRKRMPLFALVLPFLIPRSFPSNLREHQALTLQKTRTRLDMGKLERADFFSSLVRSDLSMVRANRIGEASEEEQREEEEEEGGGGGGGGEGGRVEGDVDIQYLSNQSHVLIVGGSETTATLLAGATYFLLRNPATLSRLQMELRDTFKDYDKITGDSTAMLPYLNAVIEESLRLFPPSSLGLPRICPGTAIDGRYIPAGTIVSTDPFSMTRDPTYWEDPDSFMPERWLLEGANSEETIKVNKAASQPFSTGPRSCLGKNLAWLEARLTLAKMGWKYDWDVAASSEGVDLWRDVRMWTLWKMPKWRLKFKEADVWIRRHED